MPAHFVKYLPEELVRDVCVTDTRIVSHDAFLDQISSNLRFFSSHVNLRCRRIVDKILVNDHETASINSEASKIKYY